MNHQIVSQAVVIATGITEDGGREVLGVMVGDSETEAFWTAVPASACASAGLPGSGWSSRDNHRAWSRPSARSCSGPPTSAAGFTSCATSSRVIDKDAGEMVAATIRTIFAQPTAEAVRAQLDTVADMLGQQFPKVKAMLLEAKDDLTAFADFPERHWKKIQSTNPLERINREIKRRTDVVQVFPNDDALLRLVTAVLFEMHDEWIAFPRRYLPEGSMATVYATVDTEALPGTTEG